MGKKIERCSCPESLHLRKALRMIRVLAGEETRQDMGVDLAQIHNLTHQALELEKLEGDPGLASLPANVRRAVEEP